MSASVDRLTELIAAALGRAMIDSKSCAYCKGTGWVFNDKSYDGKTYIGIIRSSFLVDEEGRIEQAWYKVKPANTVPNATAALRT